MHKRKIELSVNVYEQSVCDCLRQELHRISSNYRFFRGQRCIAALHKARRVLCTHATSHYRICTMQPYMMMIADTSRSIAFVLFVIKSCTGGSFISRCLKSDSADMR